MGDLIHIAQRLVRRYKQYKDLEGKFLCWSINKFRDTYLKDLLTRKAGEIPNSKMGPTSNTDCSIFDRFPQPSLPP